MQKTHVTLPYILTDSKQHLYNDPLLLAEIKDLWWRETVNAEWLKTAIDHSYCVSIIDTRSNQRIGFARCMTDYCSFARYVTQCLNQKAFIASREDQSDKSRITDVYVLDAHQGQGLARWMFDWILQESAMTAVPRIQLVCDGQEKIAMYEKFGFTQWHDERLYLMQIDREH